MTGYPSSPYEKKSSDCICRSQASHELFCVGSHGVRKCDACGQVYITGIDIETVTAEYDSSRYFEERNAYIAKWEIVSAHFQRIIDAVKKHKQGGTFLDVGCSVGVLLEVAGRNGFDVKGVEISAWASEFARDKGFDVVTGSLEHARYPRSFFDVVVLNHVLEHLPCPSDVLQEVQRIMKDDGLLVVGVPNFGSLAARAGRENWPSLMPDQHIWQFTRDTLRNLLHVRGFEEVYFEARDCHEVVGWRPVKLFHRVLNAVAVATNNADAMLVFARKSG